MEKENTTSGGLMCVLSVKKIYSRLRIVRQIDSLAELSEILTHNYPMRYYLTPLS